MKNLFHFIIILIALLISCFPLRVFATDYSWHIPKNDSLTHEFTTTVTDNSNNHYFITQDSKRNDYLSLFSNDGEIQWKMPVFDREYFINTDNEGNILIQGNFYDTIDVDPGPGFHSLISPGCDELYFIKLNKQMELLWAKQIGGTGCENVYGHTILKDNGIISVGRCGKKTDLDPGPAVKKPTKNNAQFIHKLNANGDLLWAKIHYDMYSDFYYAKATPDGGFIVTGSFSNTSDLDPSSKTLLFNSVGDNGDMVIQKFDKDGNLQWVRVIGSTNNDYISKSLVDAKGNIYLQSSNNGDTLFIRDEFGNENQVLNSFGYYMLLKFDADGNFVKGSSANYDAFTVDNDGNFLSIKSFRNTIKFEGQSITSRGDYDLLLSIYNPEGERIELKQIGGSGYEYASNIYVDQFNNPVIAGNIESYWEENESHTINALIVKVGNNSTANNSFEADKIIVYPTLTNGVIHIESQNSYNNVQLINMQGQMLKQWKNSSEILDISMFAPGAYVLRVNNSLHQIILQ